MPPDLMRCLRRIFPSFCEVRCVVCGMPFVPADDPAGPELCPSCALALARREGGYCPHCGNLTAMPQGAVLPCASCGQTERPWGKFLFHAAYQGVLRDALLRLKHGHELPLADLLGRLLAAHPCLGGDYDAIVPMPLHPLRLRERGFNQALELARPLARRHRLPLRPRLLLRGRDTRPQAGLSQEERKRNVLHVFAATDQAAGQRILLIDDIATTCSSLRGAANALRAAGAAGVDVAVVARTPERAMAGDGDRV